MALTPMTVERRQAAARHRYVTESVQTLTPTRLVTMLYDKLASELERGELAQCEGDRQASNDALLRAQAIVLELRSSLKVDLWSGGPRLAALYDYFVTELIEANITHAPERVAAVRRHVEPLREAWHEAAVAVATGVA